MIDQRIYRSCDATNEIDYCCDCDLELLFLRCLGWSLVFYLPTTPTPSSYKSRAPGSTQQPPQVGALHPSFHDTSKRPPSDNILPRFISTTRLFSSSQMTEFKRSKTRAPLSRSQRGNQEEFVQTLTKGWTRKDGGQ